MQIYGADSDGNIIVIFDSRWRFPELLGYSADDPMYKVLQELWEQATGRKIDDNDDAITNDLERRKEK
jgi:hypothetical protein